MIFESNFLPMALFAFATSATPGPVNVISAMTGARFGTVRSLPYVLGATASFVAILLVLGFGFQSILNIVEQVSVLLTVCGSIYMLHLAWKIAADSGDLSFAADEHRRPGFMAGVLTQATNPKAWIVSLSAITIYVGPYLDYTPRLIWFSVIYFFICAVSLTAWSFLGARIVQFTGNVIIFNRIMAGILVMAIGMILFDTVAG
jgi:threonine/homoserine/homoserine lactone efflux protein